MDWTSRLVREEKANVDPAVAPIFVRLGIESSAWEATIARLFRETKRTSRMSLLQLKREAVPPTSLTQRQPRFQTVAHESYPFGQTGLGACGRPAPGSHVTQFRENRHGWGGLSKGLEAACSNGRIRGGRRRMRVVSPRASPFPERELPRSLDHTSAPSGALITKIGTVFRSAL
jgi:hypothetical protein